MARERSLSSHYCQPILILGDVTNYSPRGESRKRGGEGGDEGCGGKREKEEQTDIWKERK